MRIITLNCNGIRSAARKGLFEWIGEQQADVICLQETRAQISQLDDEVFSLPGYVRFLHDAQRKGYSGTALYCRQPPKRVIYGIGDELIDAEGRYLEAVYGNISIVSLYLPSGSSGEVRQDFKYRMMDIMLPFLQRVRKRRRQYVFCGDWNIAHRECDIRNWRGNRKNSGFLPREREWLSLLFEQHGYVDTFRQLPQQEHEYTWWSNRGQAWANNTGWRIDYQIATPSLGKKVAATAIYRARRYSDHAPLTVDYAFEIKP